MGEEGLHPVEDEAVEERRGSFWLGWPLQGRGFFGWRRIVGGWVRGTHDVSMEMVITGQWGCRWWWRVFVVSVGRAVQ